ncbi:MAG: tetratricopeptide repeat protein [Chloroflexota bacterium]
MRQLDDRSAIGPAQESLAIRRRSGDLSGIARSLWVLGLIATVIHDIAEFRRYTEESAEFARRAGDGWALSMALSNLGYMALDAEDLDQAVPLFGEALALARLRGDRRSEAFFLENLALAKLEQHSPIDARADFLDSLRLAQRLGFIEVEATDLVGLAAVAAAQGDHLGAARLLGRAGRLLDETGGRWDRVEDRVYVRTLADIERRLGTKALASALADGRSGPTTDIADGLSDPAGRSDPAADQSL